MIRTFRDMMVVIICYLCWIAFVAGCAIAILDDTAHVTLGATIIVISIAVALVVAPIWLLEEDL